MENFSKKKVIALAVLGVLLAALVLGMNFYTEHKEQFIAASTPTPQPVDASGPQTTQTVTIPDSALQNLNVEMARLRRAGRIGGLDRCRKHLGL